MSLDVSQLREALGSYLVDDWDSFFAALQEKPPPAARLRPGSTAVSEMAWRTVPWYPQCRWTGTPASNRWQYAAGDFYIQDASSTLALQLVAGRLGESADARICDLCAAPGGKATGIAELLGKQGHLLANEPVKSRLGALSFNLARHGATHYAITCSDPEKLAATLPDEFDQVIVDAPCSGQSLMSRGKQTDASFSKRQIQHSAARQTRILAAAEALVRPGGFLIYCTCTFAREENEQQVTSFLESFPNWNIDPADELGPWESPFLSGTYRLWPHRHHCSGAFAARLNKTGESSENSRTHRKKRRRNRRGPDLDAANWGALSGLQFVQSGQVVHGWPEGFPSTWLSLAIDGPEIAFQKGQTWHPSYALAMRRDDDWRPHQLHEMSSQEVASYFRGETISNDQSGWTVVTHRSQPLGWAKGAKNHLPKGGRLSISTPPLSESTDRL